MPTFLAPLWLCAIYLSDTAAAALGLVWIGGRILYFRRLQQGCGEALARVLLIKKVFTL
jgi:glutathione S-transferase